MSTQHQSVERSAACTTHALYVSKMRDFFRLPTGMNGMLGQTRLAT